MSIHGPTYLYAGPGTWPVSVAQTQEMLETVLDSRSIKQVSLFTDVDQETRLVVIPGGHTPSIHSYFMHNTEYLTKKVSAYVESGGKLLTICAGSMLVTDILIEKPSVIDIFEHNSITALQKEGKIYGREYSQNEAGGSYSCSLYPGKCIAPHIVKHINASDPSNFCAVDVFMPSENISSVFKTCHYSGPAFLEPLVGAKVLLRYNDPMEIQQVTAKFVSRQRRYQLTGEKISEKNPVAALSYPYGSGKIILSGVHPEMNPATFAEAAKKDKFAGELPKELADHESGRKAFVDRIFTELALINQPLQ